MRRLHHPGTAAEELAHEAKRFAFTRQVGWFTLSIVILPFVIAPFFAWQGA